jgi:protein-tyrosine phosphatase
MYCQVATFNLGFPVMHNDSGNSVARCAAGGVTAAAGATASMPVTAAPASTQPVAPAVSGPRSRASAQIPFDSATVTAGTAEGTWNVEVAAPGVSRVRIFIGDSPRHLDGTSVTLRLQDGRGAIALRSKAARPWVKLDPDRGASLIVADRVVPIEGVLNARDIGGYRTVDGRWVRSGVVYRAAEVASTEAGLRSLAGLGLSTTYDLRTADEIRTQPDVLPKGVKLVNLDVQGDVTPPKWIRTAEDVHTYMEDSERQYVNSARAKAGYKTLIEGIAEDEGASLFHCRVGKDRTGWAAAIVLRLIGVDEETVMHDYLLSNEYYFNAAEVQAEIASFRGSMRALYVQSYRVEASYLQAGFDEVKKEYGSFYAYATEGLGISPETIAELKVKLLQGEPTGR